MNNHHLRLEKVGLNSRATIFGKFSVMQVELAHTTSLKEVEKFDKNALKTVETVEKNPLPDADGNLLANFGHILSRLSWKSKLVC